MFVTGGDDPDGLIGNKSPAWWENKRREVTEKFGHEMTMSCRRFERDDLLSTMDKTDMEDNVVLFCGSKSLEWQVKMWSLGSCQDLCY